MAFMLQLCLNVLFIYFSDRTFEKAALGTLSESFTSTCGEGRHQQRWGEGVQLGWPNPRSSISPVLTVPPGVPRLGLAEG